jgi:hypothetical protein
MEQGRLQRVQYRGLNIFRNHGELKGDQYDGRTGEQDHPGLLQELAACRNPDYTAAGAKMQKGTEKCRLKITLIRHFQTDIRNRGCREERGKRR